MTTQAPTLGPAVGAPTRRPVHSRLPSGAWLLRRLMIVPPMLFGLATVTFFVTRIIPGDPAYAIAGSSATPAQVEQIRRQLGFDASLWSQYLHYLSRLLHFDFGTSIFTGNSVTSDLAKRLPSTLFLIVVSLALATVLGIVAGAYAARHRGKLGDSAVRSGAFVLLALPDFWFGLLLIYVFAYRLKIAPAPIGQLSPTDPTPAFVTGNAVIDSILGLDWPALSAALAHAVLPVLTLGLLYAAPIARMTRSAMCQVLEADYVRFGRSCGLGSRVLWRYAVRASLPPVVTFVGILFAVLIGGAVLVETIFSWGGAAQYAADAISHRDYPAIQAFVLLAGIISIAVFIIIDVLYMIIDPRVRL